MLLEQWKDVEGYENIYQISNLGNARSLPRIIEHQRVGGNTHRQRVKGRLLVLQLNSKGYYRVNMGGKLVLVHRLVAKHFIYNPNNHPQVNHKDGDKLNNKVDNLEWMNNSENQKHGRSLGLIRTTKGEERENSILTEDDVRWILAHAEIKHPEFNYKKIAKKYGVCPQHIGSIMTRKKWKHVQL